MDKKLSQYIKDIESQKFKTFEDFYESDQFQYAIKEKEAKRKIFYFYAIKFSTQKYNNITKLYEDMKKIIDKIENHNYLKNHDDECYTTIFTSFLQNIEFFVAERNFFKEKNNLNNLNNIIKYFGKIYKNAAKYPKNILCDMEELYQILLIKLKYRVPDEFKQRMERYLDIYQKLLNNIIKKDEINPNQNQSNVNDEENKKKLFYNNNKIYQNNNDIYGADNQFPKNQNKIINFEINKNSNFYPNVNFNEASDIKLYKNANNYDFNNLINNQKNIKDMHPNFNPEGIRLPVNLMKDKENDLSKNKFNNNKIHNINELNSIQNNQFHNSKKMTNDSENVKKPDLDKENPYKNNNNNLIRKENNIHDKKESSVIQRKKHYEDIQKNIKKISEDDFDNIF